MPHLDDPNKPRDRDRENDRKRLKTVLATVGLVLTVFGVVAMSSLTATPVAASNHTNNSTIDDQADYYNNESNSTDSSAWFAGLENATMDDMISMAMRLGPYIIGTGSLGPGGYSGTLILGLVVTGVFVGAVAGTPIGAAGASVVALTTAYGLVEVGLAPPWLKIVLLFMLGSVAAVVVVRMIR